jgi:hypothetical protein
MPLRQDRLGEGCRGRVPGPPCGQSSPATLECVGVKQPWLCALVVRKRAGTKVPGKRKGASCEACAKLDLYFPTSRFEGVNPPNFQIYFCRRISGFAGIGCFRGFDKIWDKSDFFLIGWVWPIRPDFVGVNQKTKVSNSEQLFYCAYAIMTLETHPSLFQVL